MPWVLGKNGRAGLIMWIEYLKAGGIAELIYQVKADFTRRKCEKIFNTFPESTLKNIASEYMDQGNYKKALKVLSNA